MPAPEDDLALLTKAARAAGEIALLHWRQAPETWEKAGGAGPVTEADIAVDRMLAEELRAARPDYGWLSEESEDGAARLDCERVFIIDPIDGTRAFIAGEETFSHSLAVAERGKVTAAVVYLPALDRLYAAAAGGLAALNGRTLAVSGRAGIAGASMLTTGASLQPAQWPGGVPDIRRAFRNSMAYRLCLVAEGRHDSMLTLRDAWEWDIAAGALIAAQAGAVVTDRFGGTLCFNAPHPQTRGVLAAPPSLHAALLARLSEV